MARPFGPDAFLSADHKALYDRDKILEISDDHRLRPFGAEEYPAKLRFDQRRWSDEKVSTMSRTELVFNHLPRFHPLEGRTLHARLHIIKHLNSPENDEAQTLLCDVEEASTLAPPFSTMPKLVVAKVYDPMFYSGMDVVADADMDCAHESTAYSVLNRMADKSRTPDSTLIPGFQLQWYGAWFFLAQSQDPKFAGKTRPVRLNVFEYVKGLSISDMCGLDERDNLVPLDAQSQPIHDPPALGGSDIRNTDADVASNQLSHWQRRMFIVDAVVDGLARQVHMGVQLVGAVSPDQIIVEGGFEAVSNAIPYSPEPGARPNNKPRIVVINYTRSISGKVTAYGSNVLQKLPRPCSPIDRDSNQSLASLRGWWPAIWEDLPAPDRYDIWPLWFQRTFDTPDYIRREEADPLLDKIIEEKFEVQEAEEAKLPPHFRNDTGGLKFLHKIPGAIEDLVNSSLPATREREKIRAAENAELAKATAAFNKAEKERQRRLDKERQERLDMERREQPPAQGTVEPGLRDNLPERKLSHSNPASAELR